MNRKFNVQRWSYQMMKIIDETVNDEYLIEIIPLSKCNRDTGRWVIGYEIVVTCSVTDGKDVCFSSSTVSGKLYLLDNSKLDWVNVIDETTQVDITSPKHHVVLDAKQQKQSFTNPFILDSDALPPIDFNLTIVRVEPCCEERG